MLPKILIVDRVDPILSQKLTNAGFSCITDKNQSYSSFLECKDEYFGLIIRSRFPIDEKIILSKPNLKFIVRIGAGVEHIDVACAQKHGICCISTPEGNAPSVAEHCLGLLLSALRNIPRASNEVREGDWLRESNKGTLISSHTIGIIGYGHTGSAFAKLLSFFGGKILGYDKFTPGFSNDYITETSLENILETCDIISLHVNLLPENYHIINRDFLNRWKNPNILINSSRGQVINCDDLLNFLNEGKLNYACMDVIEYENVNLKIPPKEEWNNTFCKLMQSNKVILTPHIAGQTLDAERKHAEIAYQKIMNYFTK